MNSGTSNKSVYINVSLARVHISKQRYSVLRLSELSSKKSSAIRPVPGSRLWVAS